MPLPGSSKPADPVVPLVAFLLLAPPSLPSMLLLAAASEISNWRYVSNWRYRIGDIESEISARSQRVSQRRRDMKRKDSTNNHGSEEKKSRKIKETSPQKSACLYTFAVDCQLRALNRSRFTYENLGHGLQVQGSSAIASCCTVTPLLSLRLCKEAKKKRV